VTLGSSIHIVGPKGCGKTALVEQLVRHLSTQIKDKERLQTVIAFVDKDALATHIMLNKLKKKNNTNNWHIMDPIVQGCEDVVGMATLGMEPWLLIVDGVTDKKFMNSQPLQHLFQHCKDYNCTAVVCSEEAHTYRGVKLKSVADFVFAFWSTNTVWRNMLHINAFAGIEKADFDSVFAAATGASIPFAHNPPNTYKTLVRYRGLHANGVHETSYEASHEVAAPLDTCVDGIDGSGSMMPC
jgi:hypothetical protein